MKKMYYWLAAASALMLSANQLSSHEEVLAFSSSSGNDCGCSHHSSSSSSSSSSSTIKDCYDIIIVGMGNSGSVLANRLSENPDISVLVIDSGRDDDRVPPILPVDLPNPLPNKANNPWQALSRLGPLATYSQLLAEGFSTWQHTPLFRDDSTSRYIWYPRGAGWGGSTYHNAGVALRGNPAIYDEWAMLGNTLWSFNQLLPYFKKLENRGQLKPDGTRYFTPVIPPPQLGNFDPMIHGDTGPVNELYFDFCDEYSTAQKVSAQITGQYPGAPLGFMVDVDPDNPSIDQYLTSNNETALDQFGADFTARNPYLGPATFPDTFGPLSGRVARLQRVAAHNSYIYQVQNRDNLDILSDSLVTKVLFDHDKAVGIEYLEGNNIYQTGLQMNSSRAGIGGSPTDAIANAEAAKKQGTKTIRAKKLVILCGGSFNSPQLLMLSGIGPKYDLKQLGIHVVKDLPGVGQHLVDHGEIDVCWHHPQPYDFLGLFSIGVLPQGGIMTFAFKSDPLQPIANFSCHTLPGGFFTTWSGVGDFLDAPIGNSRYDAPPQYIYPVPQYFDPPLSQLFHSSLLMEQRAQVRSQGFVTLTSKDPTAATKIVSNLFIDRLDVQDFVAAFRDTVAPFVQNMAASGFFDQWVKPAPCDFLTCGTTLLPDKSNFNEPAFINFLLSRCWAHHASGTCKMGPKTDPRAVIDQHGRVHGVKGLRVCDCSIFPIIPTSDTQVPAYMVGERMADIIKHDLGI